MPPLPSTPSRRILDPNDPSFTPEALRVADLRSVLSSRNIRLPSSARKADLIQAVNESILTPARASQAARSTTTGGRRSVVLEERDEQPQEDEEEKDDDVGNFSDHNPFQNRSGSESEGNGSPSVKKEKAKRRSSSLLPASARTSSSTKATKGRQTIATPQSSDSGSAGPSRRAARSPSFGYSHPVSSAGFAPSPPPAAPASSSTFESYMDPVIASTTPPRKAVNEVASQASKAVKKVAKTVTGQADVDEGDEADISRAAETPDEDDSHASPPRKSILKKKRRVLSSSKPKESQSATAVLAQLARWTALVTLLSCWIFYTRETKVIGYCDTGIDSNRILQEQAARRVQRALQSSDEDAVPALADLVPSFAQPTCTPCPPHAVCSEGALKECVSSDYVLKPSLLSRLPLIHNFLPLSAIQSSCKTDSRRLEMIDELAGEMARRLGQKRGEIVCGLKPDIELVDVVSRVSQEGQWTPLQKEEARFATLESRLFEVLNGLRDPEAISDEYFDQLWSSALQELEDEGLVNIVRTAHVEEGARPSNLLIPSSSLASIPLGCQMRLTAASMLRAVSLYLFLALFGTLALYGGQRKWVQSRKEARAIDALTQEVLQRLAEQQIIALHGETNQPAHLPVNHLRDQLLSSSSSSSNVDDDERGQVVRLMSKASRSSKKRVWTEVTKRVESNANVRTAQKRWMGEWGRVWEWVGIVSAGTPIRSGSRAPSRVATPVGRRDEMAVASESEDQSNVEMEQKANRRVSFGKRETNGYGHDD